MPNNPTSSDERGKRIRLIIILVIAGAALAFWVGMSVWQGGMADDSTENTLRTLDTAYADFHLDRAWAEQAQQQVEGRAEPGREIPQYPHLDVVSWSVTPERATVDYLASVNGTERCFRAVVTKQNRSVNRLECSRARTAG